MRLPYNVCAMPFFSSDRFLAFEQDVEHRHDEKHENERGKNSADYRASQRDVRAAKKRHRHETENCGEAGH